MSKFEIKEAGQYMTGRGDHRVLIKCKPGTHPVDHPWLDENGIYYANNGAMHGLNFDVGRSKDNIFEPYPSVNAPAKEAVNHPSHYNGHPSGIECIEVVRHMGFNLGNAVKYIWRADLKNDAVEDLKKAAWYINDEIAKREKGEKK